MDLRDKNSVITEWILKLSITFYFASLFFDSYILESMGRLEAFNLGFIIKMLIIIVFGILLSVLEKNVFKIAGFASIITISFFKLLIYISQVDFNLTKVTEISDYILLIMVSIYYLHRHFRKSSRYKKNSNHKHKKSTEEE
jgi:hypothetical protein